MAPVISAVQESNALESIVCLSGQHREMLDQVVEFFNITADFNLNVMKEDQDLFTLTGSILSGMRDVIHQVRPDVILVHGDTTTTFAGSLSGFYEDIPVGHVEAGLRTGDIRSPFPEEANRILSSRLCSLHFAPTELNKRNLLAENIDPGKIYVTGNTVVDALLEVKNKLGQKEMSYWLNEFEGTLLADLSDPAKKVILITGHRRESFGQGFHDICTAIKKMAEQHTNWTFVYPVHMNPNVAKPVTKLLGGTQNVKLINPLGYFPFLYLLQKCDLVLTDSGGIQEEAPSFDKPVLVLRENTERPEGIEAGTAILVGTDIEKICAETEHILTSEDRYKEITAKMNPYGDGEASKRIVKVLEKS